MNRHLTNDELIERLYGLSGADVHLESCPECTARWSALQERHTTVIAPVAVADAMLAEQRRRIWSRVEHPQAQVTWLKWAPAAAVACLLVLGVFLYRPYFAEAPPGSIVKDAAPISDTQLFADLYAIERADVPPAAEPIRALFESEGVQ
jgi:hypothetical protein